MAFSISCKIIRLLLFIVHVCANELNVLEPGTQVDPILSQDNNLAISAGSATATSENMADYALHDQHSSNPNPPLLANENPDCAASSSNIIQSSAGRRSRMRYKRGGGGGNGAAVCEWQEFKEDGPETTTTTTPGDEQLRGKRRRPKPPPWRDPGKIGPLKLPELFNILAPAPYKLHTKADPQKCPFGPQNIPVCYPKVAIPQLNPALILSPCRIGKCHLYLSPRLTSMKIFSHLWLDGQPPFQTANRSFPRTKVFPPPSQKKQKKGNIYYSLVNERVVTDEYGDPCVLDLEDLWCCREIYTRVLPNPALIPLVSK